MREREGEGADLLAGVADEVVPVAGGEDGPEAAAGGGGRRHPVPSLEGAERRRRKGSGLVVGGAETERVEAVVYAVCFGRGI